MTETFHDIVGSGCARGGQWEPLQQGLGPSPPVLGAVAVRSEEILPALLWISRLRSGEICRVSLSLREHREGRELVITKSL